MTPFRKGKRRDCRGVRKFVKRYGDLGPGIEAAIRGYAEEVRARTFPGPDHVYGMRKKG
jgi:3-methyl-2-oxobutanoate hydroxymethyltransferase